MYGTEHKVQNACFVSISHAKKGLAFIGAFAERHEGAVPVFVRGSDTLIRASFVFERAGTLHN